MARVRLPITKKSSSLSSADSDSTSGCSKSVKSQPLSSKKRKFTEETYGSFCYFHDPSQPLSSIRRRFNEKLTEGGGGYVSHFTVPPDLYLLIREAAALRDHLKTNKNCMDSILDLESAEGTITVFAEELKNLDELPHDWKYDPEAANDYKSSIRSIAFDFNDLLDENDPPEDHLREGRDRCCAPLKNPLERYANTDDVPLSRTEKKIWKEFQKFDKKIPGLGAIYLHGFEKEKMPIKIDNPIVSLIGNFAIAAFNEAIEKYVKEGERKNLRDYEFMECSYIKMRGTEYYFYMTIEAIEEGKLGVYETKVRLEWDDGRKSLCNFILTDGTPRGKKKRVKRIQMTDPGDWLDPMEDKYTGMKPRSKSDSWMGYDYRTPWGFEGP